MLQSITCIILLSIPDFVFFGLSISEFHFPMTCSILWLADGFKSCQKVNSWRYHIQLASKSMSYLWSFMQHNKWKVTQKMNGQRRISRAFKRAVGWCFEIISMTYWLIILIIYAVIQFDVVQYHNCMSVYRLIPCMCQLTQYVLPLFWRLPTLFLIIFMTLFTILVGFVVSDLSMLTLVHVWMY